MEYHYYRNSINEVGHGAVLHMCGKQFDPNIDDKDQNDTAALVQMQSLICNPDISSKQACFIFLYCSFLGVRWLKTFHIFHIFLSYHLISQSCDWSQPEL